MTARAWWIVMPCVAVLAAVNTTIAIKEANPLFVIGGAWLLTDLWWLVKRAPWRTKP